MQSPISNNRLVGQPLPPLTTPAVRSAPSSSRRGFFVTAGRAGVLFALAAFGAWQEVKRRRLAADPNCLKLSPCAACGDFGLCPKPRAQEARAARFR